MKTLCPTHHLFYEGMECPLCRQERIEKYTQKFAQHQPVKEIKPKKTEKKREITDEDISKLMNKFNSKKIK